MGRAKESAAEAVNAVVDGAISPAYSAVSGRAESIKQGTLALSPRRARLPGPARFALAVVLSFALASLGRSFVDQCSNNEVGSITREANSQTEMFVLAAWRLYVLTRRPASSHCDLFRPPFQLRAEEADPFQLAEANHGLHGRFGLALGWFGDYDGYDLAALALLSHGPAVRSN